MALMDQLEESGTIFSLVTLNPDKDSEALEVALGHSQLSLSVLSSVIIHHGKQFTLIRMADCTVQMVYQNTVGIYSSCKAPRTHTRSE